MTTSNDVLQNIMLVSPNMGFWRGQYTLDRGKIDVAFAGDTLDEDSATTPSTRLINDRYPYDRNGVLWIKRFRAIKNEQTKILNQYSVCSGITGVRLIPKAAGMEFFPRFIGLTVGELRARMDPGVTIYQDANGNALPDDQPVYDLEREPDKQSVAYKLHLAAEEFCDDMKEIYAQIQKLAPPSIWSAVKDRIPKSREELRSKFYCGTIPIEFAATSEFSKVKVTRHDLAKYQSAINASVRQAVDSAIENMIARPRQELADAINTMTELISRNGRLTSRTFAPVQRAIEKLKLFSFISDDALLCQINKLEQHMAAQTPKNLNSSTVDSSGFMVAARNLAEELASELSIDNTVRQYRNRRVAV